MENILRTKPDRIEFVGAALFAAYLLIAAMMYLQYVHPL
jgi:hypothetical protein